MITHHIVTMLPSKNAENLRNYGKYDERGSIGIGAMIVFIALILVAGGASTSIFKTAEKVKKPGKTTGKRGENRRKQSENNSKRQ